MISHNEIYTVGNYKYKNFSMLNPYEMHQVWEWRNDISIRQFMYTDTIIPFENHCKFIDSLANRDDCYYWLAYSDNKPIGVYSIRDIDYEKKTAEGGFYIIPELHNSNLGFDFTYCNTLLTAEHFRDFIFHGSIHRNNTFAMLLNAYIGCHLDFEGSKGSPFISFKLNISEFFNNKDKINNTLSFACFVKKHKKEYLTYKS